MTDHDASIQQWWDQLSEAEQAEALAAHRSGQLTQGLQQSLASAGLAPRERERRLKAFPSGVDQFLKTRHDGN